MAWLGWVLVGFLAVCLAAGLLALVAERREWIKSKRLRRFVRKAYGLDRSDDAEGPNY